MSVCEGHRALPARRGTRATLLAALLLLPLALHLPWITAPFGLGQVNAGFYFGPFAHSYARFGFWPLRGTPLLAFESVPATPAAGLPYWNHPPGFAWITSLPGTAEWQLRAASLLATASCSVWLWLLLRPRFSALPAAAGSLLPQTLPLLALACQVSYESVVLSLGLLAFVACERARAGSRGWRAVWFATLAVGPWMDWAFGFFVLALLPLCGGGGARATVRALAWPWTIAALSAAAVAGWLLWAASAPFLAGHAGGGLGELLQKSLLDRPPPARFLAGLAHTVARNLTLPVLGALLLGLWPALRADRRLLAAAAIPGVCNILAFPQHSSTHDMFSAYLVPVVALAIAALLHGCGRRPWLQGAVAALLAVAPLAATLAYRQLATEPLFARLGAALTALADAQSTDKAGRPNYVATNAPQVYPYYVRSTRVNLFPCTAPARLEALRNGAFRLRFLHLDFSIGPAAAAASPPPRDPLRDYLAAFPSRRLPQLEGRWTIGDELVLTVYAARVHDL